MDRWTPRVVYNYFLKVFKITYGVGIAGYTFFVLAFFGLPAMFMIKPETWLDLAILLLFYGVYFGVITKDIADMCTDRMASTIGTVFIIQSHFAIVFNLEFHTCRVMHVENCLERFFQ